MIKRVVHAVNAGGGSLPGSLMQPIHVLLGIVPTDSQLIKTYLHQYEGRVMLHHWLPNTYMYMHACAIVNCMHAYACMHSMNHSRSIIICPHQCPCDVSFRA
jgi:hypothetical protein